jgi:hypothetical protein
MWTVEERNVEIHYFYSLLNISRIIIFLKTRHATYMEKNNNCIDVLVGNKPEARRAPSLHANRDIKMKQGLIKYNERGWNILQCLYNENSRVMFMSMSACTLTGKGSRLTAVLSH